MPQRKEISYGIIPLRKRGKQWQTLLVRHGKGHWAFPKGHPEQGEDAKQTAVRELEEETGLKVSFFLDMDPLQEHYFFRHGPDLINKTVIYFPAQVKGKISLQHAEISDYKWLSLEEAQTFATFKETQRLCSQILQAVDV